MAATSGFFVPPTVGTPGASQKRVTATGVTPQASRVSVTDGTRLTTTSPPAHRGDHHSRSSSWAFLAWNSASVMRPRRRSPSSSSIWAGIDHGRTAGPAPARTPAGP